MGSQIGASFNTAVIGGLILWLGVALARNAGSRGEENTAATIFIPLGVAIILIGVGLLIYVIRRRDWSD